MDSAREFVDFYALLEVDPDCTPRTLELAYHSLAKRFHPDNRISADSDRFNEVMEAYRFLKDAEKRAEYDQLHFPEKSAGARSALQFDDALDEKTVLGDAEMNARILLYLYRRRREKASDAGVLQWLLQETFECAEDEFDFHVWYLKSKGFIEVDSSSAISITILGVDEVMAQSRAGRAERLLLTLATPEAEEGGRPSGGSSADTD